MFKVWNGQLPITIGGSHMLLWRFFAFFIITQAESYRFLDFHGYWASGQLIRHQPRNAPYVYGTVKPARKQLNKVQENSLNEYMSTWSHAKDGPRNGKNGWIWIEERLPTSYHVWITVKTHIKVRDKCEEHLENGQRGRKGHMQLGPCVPLTHLVLCFQVL